MLIYIFLCSVKALHFHELVSLHHRFLESLDYDYENNYCTEDQMCGHYTQVGHTCDCQIVYNYTAAEKRDLSKFSFQISISTVDVLWPFEFSV